MEKRKEIFIIAFLIALLLPLAVLRLIQERLRPNR